jgi:ABC-2 type transport system permease protein
LSDFKDAASQQGFQVLVQILILPLIFLAGVFFPISNVPAWMEVISKVNPLTYGVDAARFSSAAHSVLE